MAFVSKYLCYILILCVILLTKQYYYDIMKALTYEILVIFYINNSNKLGLYDEINNIMKI